MNVARGPIRSGRRYGSGWPPGRAPRRESATARRVLRPTPFLKLPMVCLDKSRSRGTPAGSRPHRGPGVASTARRPSAPRSRRQWRSASSRREATSVVEASSTKPGRRVAISRTSDSTSSAVPRTEAAMVRDATSRLRVSRSPALAATSPVSPWTFRSVAVNASRLSLLNSRVARSSSTVARALVGWARPRTAPRSSIASRRSLAAPDRAWPRAAGCPCRRRLPGRRPGR